MSAGRQKATQELQPILTTISSITLLDVATQQQHRIDAQRGIYIIGRHDTNQKVDLDLTVSGGYGLGVSRQHLRIEFHDKGVFAVDLGSRNGTRLNGEKLKQDEMKQLHNGDLLIVGSYRFEVMI